MSKQRLLELLEVWKKKAEWWYKMDMAAAWIDNGNGGCMDCTFEYRMAKSKIELLEQLISECK